MVLGVCVAGRGRAAAVSLLASTPQGRAVGAVEAVSVAAAAMAPIKAGGPGMVKAKATGRAGSRGSPVQSSSVALSTTRQKGTGPILSHPVTRMLP